MMEKLLGMPVNGSLDGGQIDQLIFFLHVLMVVLFVGWGAFFAFVLFRFRRGKQQKADYVGVRSHASSYVEATVVVLELILLFGFSIPFWSKKVAAMPPDENPFRVRVVAQQFAWNIHYPGPDGKFGKTDISLVNEATNPIGLDRKNDSNAKDDIVKVNQLHMPVNRTVILDVTSKDVIHSVFLPNFRVKQDAIPGLSVPIFFTPTRTTAEIQQELREKFTFEQLQERNAEKYVPVEDIKDKDGKVVARKGRRLTKSVMTKVEEAGVTELEVMPDNPTEIACAQLCGLTHAKMVGYVTVETQTEFDDWYKEQLEYLE